MLTMAASPLTFLKKSKQKTFDPRLKILMLSFFHEGQV